MTADRGTYDDGYAAGFAEGFVEASVPAAKQPVYEVVAWCTCGVMSQGIRSPRPDCPMHGAAQL
jgi:hypothetical protein